MFSLLRERLDLFSESIAVVSNGNEYKYLDLKNEIDKKEQYFKDNGVKKGDVVVIVGEFSLSAIAGLIALFFSSATVIPLTKVAYDKLKQYTDLLDIDFIFDTYENTITKVRLPPALDRANTWRSSLPAGGGGLVVFTSGSTGTPKAIVHDVNTLCYRYEKLKKPIRSICFLLFDHMGGINTILFLLFHGGTAVNVEERQVDLVCRAIEKYKVQLLPATPSFLSQFLIANAYTAYNLSSLEVISYGTEVMSEVVLKKLNQVLPHCVFKQTYGLSETGVFQIKSKSNDSLWFKFIDDGVETKIIDNVLWIKTKSNLLGKILFNNGVCELDRVTSEWFCTNDIVETENEYLKILGRNTDIINVGGLKVYPSEVENCIQQLDFVDDVFVQGKKHPMLGHMVVAHVLLKTNVDKNIIEKEIKRHCLANLEKFKVPSKFIFEWDNFINDRFKKVRTA